MASTKKIIASHFAIFIDKPSIPCAPNIYVTNAKTSKITASPIKPDTFHSPTYLNNKSVASEFQEKKVETPELLFKK